MTTLFHCRNSGTQADDGFATFDGGFQGRPGAYHVSQPGEGKGEEGHVGEASVGGAGRGSIISVCIPLERIHGHTRNCKRGWKTSCSWTNMCLVCLLQRNNKNIDFRTAGYL